MDHQITITGFDSMEDLATAIGNLRYDPLHDFLYHLHDKLSADAKADAERMRTKLSASLYAASLDTGQAAKHIKEAWRHSEPHMRNDIYDISDMD